MNDLKNILKDAARYRWLREQYVTVRQEFDECVVSHPMLRSASLDAVVDSEISCLEDWKQCQI